MSLVVPGSPEFLWTLDTAAGRPSSTKGTSVAPGASNAKGSWVELIDGALVVNDVWGIQVVSHAGSSPAQARNMLMDVGIDPAAGTSYTTIIADLMVSCAGDQNPGISYYFPLHIPAGASIAVRAAVNNATAGTMRVFAVLQGEPRNPDVSRKGHVVESIGITGASSSGTAVTSGTASEGSWTSLGTVTRQAWWWQAGFGVSDSTMVTQTYGMDLSAGSAGGDTMLIEEQLVGTTSAETVATRCPQGLTARGVAAGSTVYGRLQCSGTADSNLSMAAYALS